ncbi:CAP domain-containing protein [Duganella sp. BJB476]|uniref:CAP domain-containing protein n=1 Tax=Duganella sp. BJB476 TaxID=1871176 RepID=UPI000E350B1A|nr:CAP domain-containing protein [Duganella sp. BJB476]RFP28721.1 CAP domain-containing protein [Duganella sp. BJB476]
MEFIVKINSFQSGNLISAAPIYANSSKLTKRKFMRSKTRFVLSLAMTLTACGGGGSSSVPQAVTPPVVAPPIADVNELVKTVSAPIYTSDSGNLIVFNAVNALREKIGSGLLAQSTMLDQAALAHWKYLDANTIVSLHSETEGKSGFTGVDATARAKAVGYSGAYVDEVIFGTNGADNFAGCAASWANSVYHIGVYFSGMRDIGVSALTTKDDPVYGKYTVCVTDFSLVSSKSEQLPADGTVRVYPYPDQTAVPIVFYNQAESPTPLPQYQELGTPVTLNFKTKSFAAAGAKPSISVSQLTITPAGAQPLTARVLANLNAGGVLTAGPELIGDDRMAAYTLTVVPIARMVPNTVYTVSFSGTVNGASISKSWKFTTAAN